MVQIPVVHPKFHCEESPFSSARWIRDRRGLCTDDSISSAPRSCRTYRKVLALLMVLVLLPSSEPLEPAIPGRCRIHCQLPLDWAENHWTIRCA